MKYLGMSVLALVCTIAASAARADDDPYAKNGAYIGIGASYGVPLFDASIENAFPGDSKTSNSWGVNGRAGYRFHKFLAGEVEYEWMSHFGTRLSNNSGKIGLDSAALQTITANLKVFAPYRQFQPYVLVGFGATLASLDQPGGVRLVDYSHTSYSTRFGLGIDYYLTENVALNFGSEFVVNTAKISNTIDGDGSSRGFDYYSAQGGLTFKF